MKQWLSIVIQFVISFACTVFEYDYFVPVQDSLQGVDENSPF